MTEYIKKTGEQKRGTNFYLYYRQQAYQISHSSGLNYHEKHSIKNRMLKMSENQSTEVVEEIQSRGSIFHDSYFQTFEIKKKIFH